MDEPKKPNDVDAEAQPKDSDLFRLQLSTAVCAAICLRDLIRIGYFFPNAIETQEANRLYRILIDELEAALKEDLLIDKIGNELLHLSRNNAINTLEWLSALYPVMLFHHPEIMPCLIEDKESGRANMQNLIKKCVEESLGNGKEIADYLIQCKINDCRYPTPLNDDSFKEPRRYLQMLKLYWELCRQALMDKLNHQACLNPYPLSTLFIKIQSRLQVCFDGLPSSTIKNKEDIAGKIDSLIEALTYASPDEIQIGGELLIKEVQEIDLWLEKTQIMLGTKVYPVTMEENTFLKYAKACISEYDQQAHKLWQKMLNRVTPPAPQNPESKNMASNVVFPLPKGMGWKEITIRFTDGHTVAISAGDKWHRYNYTQMGMVNKKNSDFTKQWELLQSFAEYRGEIGWSSRYAGNKLKKQKQELSKRLRDFFRLDDDPIEWVKDDKVYRCRFRILPEEADDY